MCKIILLWSYFPQDDVSEVCKSIRRAQRYEFDIIKLSMQMKNQDQDEIIIMIFWTHLCLTKASLSLSLFLIIS